jgi:hypothetical protein
MLAGVEVQEVLPKSGRGPRKALIWGWPTPIRLNARTELPPEPRRPVYGPAARQEVRRLMRDAKRERINLGWASKISLCKVARGERPLGYCVWTRTCDYLSRNRAERELARKPLRVQFGAGGVYVVWRRPGP